MLALGWESICLYLMTIFTITTFLSFCFVVPLRPRLRLYLRCAISDCGCGCALFVHLNLNVLFAGLQ